MVAGIAVVPPVESLPLIYSSSLAPSCLPPPPPAPPHSAVLTRTLGLRRPCPAFRPGLWWKVLLTREGHGSWGPCLCVIPDSCPALATLPWAEGDGEAEEPPHTCEGPRRVAVLCDLLLGFSFLHLPRSPACCLPRCQVSQPAALPPAVGAGGRQKLWWVERGFGVARLEGDSFWKL